MSERVRQEVRIHARLKHPAIVELISFFEDASYVYLVLELCHNGELAKYLKNTEHAFTEGEARIIFEQVVSGVKYLHNQVFRDRDLTLANLMITSDKHDQEIRSHLLREELTQILGLMRDADDYDEEDDDEDDDDDDDDDDEQQQQHQPK